ncbi:hypothetical protein CCHL11_06132 [Colletotrichum chlorophyti]|uniref:CENP-V/GFA domain-containing protein n=1 Tax=Colletotrichum chlorophyti TaxID=708187 RepID=A0A1Q8RT67_9PEZI|nr:hypothetical protein CCHL11_06132 [Colletotrichum chlorophyti]
MSSMKEKEIPRDQMSTKTLTAQCYCKSVHFTLSLPLSLLPLKVHLCHCSTCRSTHGTLCVFHAALPPGVSPAFIAPSSLSSLTAYRHAAASSTRYFCSTCSCHIGDVGIDDDDWVISASIFDANTEDFPAVWDIRQHVNTTSAPGGGLYNWLQRMAGGDMKVWNPKDQSGGEDAAPEREVGTNGEDVLRARCHCGGVSFTISRPTPSMLEDEGYQAWISPIESNKWMACLDVCDDCRLQTGAHAVAWVFVPESCIKPRLPEDLKIGSSKAFASSDGVLRSFCGTCGATVLGYFGCDGKRRRADGDRLLNVAVGILRAPDGVLAEEWLTWRTGRVAWSESGMRYDFALTEALSEGMARWGREKHGEIREFNID